MESRTQSPILTPTYQSILVLDLRQVNECFFHGAYLNSFEALRILYSDLLKKPRNDLRADWETFLAQKEMISVSGGTHSKRNLKLRDRLNCFLYTNIPEIKSKFIEVLEKYNLLNQDRSYPISKLHFDELEGIAAESTE